MLNLSTNLSSKDQKIKMESAKKILKNISLELGDEENSVLQDTSFLGWIIEDSELWKRVVKGEIHPRTHELLKMSDRDEFEAFMTFSKTRTVKERKKFTFNSRNLQDSLNKVNHAIAEGCLTKILSKQTKNSNSKTLESKKEPNKHKKKVEQKPVEEKPSITDSPAAPLENKQKVELPKKFSSALSKSGDQNDDTSSKQRLNWRKDVVHKTLLQSMKNFYRTEFEARTEHAALTKTKQEKQCLKIIDKFTREIFAEYIILEKTQDGEEKEIIKGVEFIQISKFMLSLIVPSKVNLYLKNTDTFKTYNIFNVWIFKYSNKQLEAALAIPAIACVFTIFLDGPIFENLLANDATMRENQEAYSLGKYPVPSYFKVSW
jgi:hypothetical protein